jgi:hypothetical protein
MSNANEEKEQNRILSILFVQHSPLAGSTKIAADASKIQ